MIEVWKDIKEYEGLYQVSNFGRVKSLSRKNDIIMRPSCGEYKRVNLRKNGKYKSFYVHRLVAQNFIPNLKNKPQVNHKDENKYNNCVNNLEWCTHIENMNYGTKRERESKVKTRYHVLQYDLKNRLIKKWNNLREIMLNTKYDRNYISKCCTNKIKTAYGYKWKYISVDSQQ